MLTTAPPRPASHAFSLQADLVMAHRQTESRPDFGQAETLLRIDVGTFVADDSLVIDSISAERLHELPASIVTFQRRAFHRGYCPPVPVLRRLDFRARGEIEVQRLAEC